MYMRDTAQRVAAKQSILAHEERYVLFVPDHVPSGYCYDVVSPEDLDTYYAGYRDSDIFCCYVNGKLA
jgi:hypothetical protein